MEQEPELAEAEPVVTPVEIGASARFLCREHARYKVLHGGRGSLKSWSAARALLVLGGQRRLCILCAREFQNSIEDSVHKLLKEQVELLGLEGFYTVQKTAIYGANGTEFIFKGLRANIEAIKSTEGIDICWVEEAERVSHASWEVLIPTVRREDSEIWVTFNPGMETDPTYQRFVVHPPPGAIVRPVSWKDNPWLPDVLRQEAEHLRRTDPDAFAHVWGGETWSRSDAQIFKDKWIVDDFTPVASWAGPYYGADWGFSQDPTALLKLWIHEPRVYIEHEAFETGCELDKTAALFDTVPGSRQHLIRADCARPETINHVRSKGFDIVAADKWPGSVEDGITFLRGFDKVVIHPRCRNMEREARLYSYKVDRLTSDVLPDIVDKHNHGWDAVRYALDPLVQHKQTPSYRPTSGLYKPRR